MMDSYPETEVDFSMKDAMSSFNNPHNAGSLEDTIKTKGKYSSPKGAKPFWYHQKKRLEKQRHFTKTQFMLTKQGDLPPKRPFQAPPEVIKFKKDKKY